jgi:AcrR family transcriptional regulator
MRPTDDWSTGDSGATAAGLDNVPMATTAAPSGRLGVGDWVDAALDILAEEGARAIKISRLCARLGATKGSFYWHFADLDEFLGAVAQRWAAGLDSARHEFSQLGSLEPVERLRRMAYLLVDERMWRLERAMREWARSDDRVQAAVATGDRQIVELIRAALLELGFSAADADLRARALYYLGIGFIHVGPRNGDRGQLDELLRIMTRP